MVACSVTGLTSHFWRAGLGDAYNHILIMEPRITIRTHVGEAPPRKLMAGSDPKAGGQKIGNVAVIGLVKLLGLKPGSLSVKGEGGGSMAR